MKRYLFSLLSLLFLFAAPAPGQQPETMRVNADRVNLRKAPSTDSAVVRGLTKGALVTVVSRDGNWVKVQLQGQSTTGWVRSDLLDPVPVPFAPGAPSPVQNQTAPPPPPATGAPTPPPASVPPPKPPAEPKDASYRAGFTVFGGVTMFKAVITPASTLNNANGFMGGAGIISHLGGPIGIEIDGAYVQKGFALTAGGATDTEHDNYGQGAFLLRPAFGSGPVRFFLLGGGEVGYLINCTYATTGSTAPGSCTIDNNTVNRMDYGLLVGGGVSFGPLAVQVRYDMGIANLSKTTGTTAKNQGLMVLGSLIL